MNVVEAEEEEEAPPSSSFAAEAVAGHSKLLSRNDIRAHQDLLKRVTVNPGLETEELKESAHSLINILVATAPSKVVLPINEMVMRPVKTLWQT